MNIVECLGKDLKIFHFDYFGKNDFASGYDVELLFSNKLKILDFFEGLDYSIVDFDMFVNYLFLNKFSYFLDYKEQIIENKRDEFEQLISKLKSYAEQYDTGKIIKYVNVNCENLIVNQTFSLVKQLFYFSIKYHSGCLNCIKAIIEKKVFLIVNYWNDCKEIILNKKYNYIDNVLEIKHFNELKHGNLKVYLSMIKDVLLRKDIVKKANKAIDAIIKYANELYQLINDDNIIQYESQFKMIVEFLVSIKNHNANEFVIKLRGFEEVRNNYLKKHGQKFDYSYSLKPLKEIFDNEKIPLAVKILYITHSLKNGKFENNFTSLVKKHKNSLFDVLCSSTQPTDTFFSLSMQQDISLHEQIELNVLNYYMNSNKIIDFISTIASFTLEAFERLNIDVKEKEIEKDFNLLLNLILDLFNSIQSKNCYLETALCYSAIMFSITFIEKLLRLYNVSKLKKIYFKEDWGSIGHLLNPDENIIMSRQFGKNHLKILEFYLAKGTDFVAGYNYRNNFAHYKNIKQADMNSTTFLRVFYLLVDIINTIYIKEVHNNIYVNKTKDSTN